MAKWLLLFTVVPLCELYLLRVASDHLGLWPIVGVVLASGMVGAWCARAEGMRVVRRWQKALIRGKAPEEGVLGGVLLLVGALLLVTPGFITDVCGLLLLLPKTRITLAQRLRVRIEKKIREAPFQVVSYSDIDDGVRHGPGDGSWGPPNVVMDVAEELLEVEDDQESSRPRDRRVLH